MSQSILFVGESLRKVAACGVISSGHTTSGIEVFNPLRRLILLRGALPWTACCAGLCIMYLVSLLSAGS